MCHGPNRPQVLIVTSVVSAQIEWPCPYEKVETLVTDTLSNQQMHSKRQVSSLLYTTRASSVSHTSVVQHFLIGTELF